MAVSLTATATATLQAARFPALCPRSESKPFEPDTEAMKRRLLRGGVVPTPKILHALRKKETQKALRRSKKRALQQETPTLSEPQRQALEEEAHFRSVSAEYRAVKAELERRAGRAPALVGKPWEGSRVVDLRALGSAGEGDVAGRLKGEYLEELSGILAERSGERLRWLLDDDVEEGERIVEERGRKVVLPKQNIGDDEKIRLLIQRLSTTNLDMHDWQFSRLMKQSSLFFSEMHLLKIVEGLGALGNWRHALSVVEWVYNEKHYKHRKSRFVYTKLLAVLGKSRRPGEALDIFNLMREDAQIYPDMAAYHTIAVTLGQAGLVKKLISIVECMRRKPSKKLKNMRSGNWDPCLEPDVIVYNAVLNACIPSQQWKGVYWVLEQMRASGLKPTGATYGLAMEVMLKAGKYDLVHNFFEKMRRCGLPPKALTYKALVRTFWEEGKIDEAVSAVRDMEQRGVVGTASVYYELACCLCSNGRWRDAMVEVDKLKRLPLTKPLEVTFTGMILSSLDGGYVSDCISIFEDMKDHCAPNIGTINAMLKVYGRNDMFANAKELFESIKNTSSGSDFHIIGGTSLKPDAYSYISMLEASASAQQWDYFEYVYKEMALCGYQLDQKKNAWLLVEASRSGKGHLLEHAFDTILDAGEIPHVSLFTEMICQAIAQNSFERTITLINGMAHASLHVSEDQWTNLFQRNKGRFGEDSLPNLLNLLGNNNIVMEDPVLSLLKSLQSLCGPSLSKNTLALAAPSNVSADNLNYENEMGVERFGMVQACLPNRILVNNVGSLQCNGKDPVFSDDNASSLADYQELVDGMPSTTANECKESKSILDGCSDASITDEALDLLTAHLSSSFSKLPSALEILETWREGRVKDGIFRH